MRKTLLAGSLFLLLASLGCRLFLPTHVPVVSTNRAGASVTNWVTRYQVNPGLTNALGNAERFAQDFPWGHFAQGVLGTAVAVLTWVAKKKSDRAALVPALIAGIEDAPNNQDVKTSIHRIARETRLERRLNRAVKQVAAARARRDFGKPI